MQTVAIIDYGMGNLRSVAKAIEHVGGNRIRVVVTADADEIQKSDRVIFPGQGAAGACMQALRDHDLGHVIHEVSRVKPFLGICMGLQVLMSVSDENGGTACLDVVSGKVVGFDHPVGAGLKVPHMGWNQVVPCFSHALWQGIAEATRFYFVHSYHVMPAASQIVAATTEYGGKFVSAIAFENVFAVQFHPEKSAVAGLKLLSNFIGWNGGA